METKSIIVQTLCVPCACRCRYCLLSWGGKTVGAPYEQSKRFAKRFYEWIQSNRPDVSYHFSFGYSMEHPSLPEEIDFLQSIGSVGGRLLQMDGMALRTDRQQDALMETLLLHGVERVNYTLYGAEPYHDRFACRAGDYQNILRGMRAAHRAGLSVSAGIPLTKENLSDVSAVIAAAEDCGANPVRLFIPHAEGRGHTLDAARCTADDLVLLSEPVRKRLNETVYRLESAWYAAGEAEAPQKRSLILSLTPKNLPALEQTPFDRILKDVERLDEAYYASFPSEAELFHRYGDPNGTRLYARHDLLAHYRAAYLAETGISVYDVTDERQTGSRRY